MRAEFEDILRFWLDRGVDGFRVDVAHGLVKADGLPDVGYSSLTGRNQRQSRLLDNATLPYFDQDGVHEIYRAWRPILDSYPGGRMAVAEAWASTPQRLARYVGPDELHQVFNFDFLDGTWTADSFRKVIDTSLAEARDRRRADHLGAVQPRQAAARHPVRRRRRRPAPGPRGRPADARPARRRRTSTRARSWACRRCSTCPTRCARTRRSGVPATAATAAGCRCPGPATSRRTPSARRAAPTRGCRRRPPGRRSAWRRRPATRLDAGALPGGARDPPRRTRALGRRRADLAGGGAERARVPAHRRPAAAG